MQIFVFIERDFPKLFYVIKYNFADIEIILIKTAENILIKRFNPYLVIISFYSEANLNLIIQISSNYLLSQQSIIMR